MEAKIRMEQIIMTINKSIIYLDKSKTLITFVLAVFKIKYGAVYALPWLIYAATSIRLLKGANVLSNLSPQRFTRERLNS